VTSAERKAFGKALDNYRRKHGMNQVELARRIDVSQPHLSRLISGSVPAGNRLKFRIARLLAVERTPAEHIEWLRKIEAVAGRSEAFKRLVNAAVEIFADEIGSTVSKSPHSRRNRTREPRPSKN
jgi:transcriptional regulator with XRE-family HTH domain